MLTFLATGTFRGEEMVVVVDAINFVVNVDREGHSVEAFVAHATAEAAGVIRFAHRVQDLSNESQLAGVGGARLDPLTISMIR